MVQPLEIICPAISPFPGAPSAISGKSESDTGPLLMSPSPIFRRFARSFLAAETALSLVNPIIDRSSSILILLRTLVNECSQRQSGGVYPSGSERSQLTPVLRTPRTQNRVSCLL